MFKDVWVPIISAVLGGCFGSIVTFFSPKLWQVFERRYVDPKTALLETLHSQVDGYTDRASKLATFSFELSWHPLPDIFKRQVLISRLDPKDREWAIKETDIAGLKEGADYKAAECRENAAQAARWTEQVGDKTFFPL